MSKTSLRVATYARVSTDQQAQQQTIVSQVEAIKERMVQDDVRFDNDLCFCDDGFSGETLQRPALERLRDQVAAGAIDRLYVHSPDRLARKYAYQVLVVEEFRRAGVEIIFVNHAVDQTPEGELLLQVQGMIAEYERAKILERSRRGKRYSAKSGCVSAFSRAPYGYHYVDKRQGGGVARFDVIAEEAEVVGKVFRWYVQERLPISAIARRLTAEGITTRTGKAHWCGSMIQGMLRNPAYQGQAIYGRCKLGPRQPRKLAFWRGTAGRSYSCYPTVAEEQITVPVPALISNDLFAVAQVQLEENRRRNRVGLRGPRHLLQGLVVCQHCRHSLIYFISGGKRCRRSGEPYFYYRCTGLDTHRWGGQRVCSSRAVRADFLEKAVWDDVVALLADSSRLEQEFQRRLTETEAAQERSGRPVQQLVERVQRSISRLIDAYQEGTINRTEFEPRLQQARDRLAALEREAVTAAEREQQRHHLQEVVLQFRMFADQVKANLQNADLQTKIKILRLLIKQVEVDQEEVRIVYKIGQLPFDRGSGAGCLQDCPRREAVAVPVEQLDPVAPLAAKDKEMPAERIGAQELADHPGQAVEAAPHVGRLRAQEDADRQRQAQHGRSSSSTTRSSRRVAASKPAGTRTTRPEPSTTSRRLAEAATRTGTKRTGAPAGQRRRLGRLRRSRFAWRSAC